MKKRTVITTETREVWVIRQPSEDTTNFETGGKATDPFADSPLPDEHLQTHSQPDETTSIRTEEQDSKR